MADATRVSAGTGEFYFGVAAPANLTPLVLDASGIPLTGQQGGLTVGDHGVIWDVSKNPIEPNQTFSRITSFKTAERFALSLEFLEVTNPTLLQTFFQQGTAISSTKAAGVSLGGHEQSRDIVTGGCFVVKKVNGPGWLVVLGYELEIMGTVDFKLSKTAATMYGVTLEGNALFGRADGDHLAQIIEVLP